MAVEHRWRVRKDSGTFHVDGKGKFEPGETFTEYPHVVFRLARHLEDLGPIEPYPEPTPITERDRGDGTFDILHGVTGLPINDRPLTAEEAKPMLRLLRGRPTQPKDDDKTSGAETG
jgi:hypothetical protein